MICRKRKGTAVAEELSVSGLQTLLSDFSSGVLGELNLDLDLDFDFPPTSAFEPSQSRSGPTRNARVHRVSRRSREGLQGMQPHTAS